MIFPAAMHPEPIVGIFSYIILYYLGALLGKVDDILFFFTRLLELNFPFIDKKVAPILSRKAKGWNDAGSGSPG